MAEADGNTPQRPPVLKTKATPGHGATTLSIPWELVDQIDAADLDKLRRVARKMKVLASIFAPIPKAKPKAAAKAGGSRSKKPAYDGPRFEHLLREGENAQ